MTLKKGFIYNTIILILGNGGAQAINLLTIPIITRLYTPDSFGCLALLVSVATVLIEISCLRYQMAILIPQEKTESANVFALSCIVCLVFSIGTACIVFFIYKFSLFGIESYHHIFWILPIIVFTGGIYKPLNVWSLRENHFIGLSLSRVSETAGNKGLAIFLGIIKVASEIELTCSFLFGKMLSIFIIIYISLKNELLKMYKIVSLQKIISMASRYKSFAAYSLTAVTESFSNEVLLIFSGFFYGSATVGFIGLTKNVIQQPLSMIGDAISRSFFQKVSHSHRNQEKYQDYTFDLFRTLLSITLIPVALFACISPQVFEFFFGKGWDTAGLYFSILSISILSGFLYRPFSIIFDVQEKQRLRFWLNSIRLCINIATFCGGVYLFNSVVSTLLLFAIFNTILLLGQIIILLKLAGVDIMDILGVIMKQLFATGILVLITFILQKYIILDMSRQIILVTGFVLLHFAFIYCTNPRVNKIVTLLIRKE